MEDQRHPLRLSRLREVTSEAQPSGTPETAGAGNLCPSAGAGRVRPKLHRVMSMSPAEALIAESSLGVSLCSKQILDLLRTDTEVSDPLLYSQILLQSAQLFRVWDEHRRLISMLLSSLQARDPHLASLVGQWDEESAAIQRRLKCVISADKPRSPQLGVNAARYRVKEIANRLLAQLERERTSILPFLQAPRAPAVVQATA